MNPTDAADMIKLTPSERLEWLLQQTSLAHAHQKVEELLAKYEEFLKVTNAEEKELVSRFLDKNASQELMKDAYRFGELVFEVLTSIGQANVFYRLLVV